MPLAADRRQWIGGVLGAAVTACAAAAGGRNARVYRVELADGRKVCLKIYPRHPWDDVDRYARERDALALLARIAPQRSPCWLAGDDAARCGLLSWIDGAVRTTPGRADLADAIDFAGLLFAASTPGHPEHAGCVARFGAASAACPDRDAIVAQIARRREHLGGAGELAAFLAQRFDPALAAALAGTEGDAAAACTAAERRLVAADLGFHNALIAADGCRRYLDFEYLGWDDPIRLLADFALHPGHTLATADRRWLLAAGPARLGLDAGAERRLARLLPLYALRWAAIALNEFLPDRLRARAAAGWPADPESWHDLRRQQLARAADFVELARYSLANGTLP